MSEEKMARLNEVYGERSLRDRDNGLDWHLVCALLVTKAGGRMELDEREYHYAREWARRGYSITRTDEDRLRQLIVIEANPDLRGATMPPSQYMAPLVSKPPPAADDLMKQLMQTIAPPTPPAKVPPTKIDFTPEPPPPPPGPVKKRKRSEASRTRIHNDG